MDYIKTKCPYDAGQLLIAHNVLKWAVEQDDRLHTINSQTRIDAIDDIIMN